MPAIGTGAEDTMLNKQGFVLMTLQPSEKILQMIADIYYIHSVYKVLQ